MLDRPSGATKPDQAAEQFVNDLRHEGVSSPEPESLTINNLPARRVALLAHRDDGSVAHLDITWLLHRGVTYRLIAIATATNLATVRGVVESFHDLTAAERGSIKVTRLRVISAYPGETLAVLSRRTDNQWDEKMTAVVNGLDAATPLRAGQLIKVARTEAYESP
jgi:predicted Zn-dependent protease